MNHSIRLLFSIGWNFFKQENVYLTKHNHNEVNHSLEINEEEEIFILARFRENPRIFIWSAHEQTKTYYSVQKFSNHIN